MENSTLDITGEAYFTDNVAVSGGTESALHKPVLNFAPKLKQCLDIILLQTPALHF